MRVGDPLDEATQMGPLISAAQREHGRIATSTTARRSRSAARRPTARASGSRRPSSRPVSNDDRAAREEIFGPVAAVIPFDDEAEAVRLANDTIYGLSGSIWTRDGAAALRVARAIETGDVSINSNTSVRVLDAVRRLQAVGLGRELGPHALDALHRVRRTSTWPPNEPLRKENGMSDVTEPGGPGRPTGRRGADRIGQSIDVRRLDANRRPPPP